MKQTDLLTILSLSSCLLLSCCKDDNEVKPVDPGNKESSVEMYFDSRYGADDFELDKVYSTANNDQIKFARAGYYISNVELVKADGSTFKEPKSYHLIWLEEDTKKETFKIKNVPADNYVKIRFIVGIDSVQNASVPGTGDLAADSHMSWMWTTSYVFFHSQGYYKVPTTSAFDSTFLYDIGHNRSMRRVELSLPSPMRVDEANNPKVQIHSDFKVQFGGPNVMNIKSLSRITGAPTSAADSKLVADNYATMFKIHAVE